MEFQWISLDVHLIFSRFVVDFIGSLCVFHQMLIADGFRFDAIFTFSKSGRGHDAGDVELALQVLRQQEERQNELRQVAIEQESTT